MKKFYFIVILLIFSDQAFGQLNIKDFVWGGRVGLNYSNIRGEDSGELDVKTGGVIGVFSRHKIGNGFLIQPEINYTTKGGAQRVTIFNPETNISTQLDFTVSFDYLEIPIFLKYNFNSHKGDFAKPELFMGAFTAFKLATSVELDNSRGAGAVDLQNIKGADFGIAFGGGIGFAVDNVDLLIELRYTLSLPSYDNSGDKLDLKHGVFSLTTGFVVN